MGRRRERRRRDDRTADRIMAALALMDQRIKADRSEPQPGLWSRLFKGR
jgi:hypothetical protein